MTMSSRNLQRLERLEAALRPIGRVFLLWDDYDGTTDEKIAACRAENDVQSHDVIHTIGFLRDDHPEPAI